MALLSATQGTPDRIWSLLRILAAHDGAMSRNELAMWLNPNYLEDGDRRNEDSTLNQTVQAASGLGLIAPNEKNELALEAGELPDRYADFPRFIHMVLSNLRAEDADRLLFDVFSCVVVQSHKDGGTNWIYALKNTEFANYVNQSLMMSDDVEGDRRFNDTKLPHWRRWMEFLGLQSHLPSGEHFPYIAACLNREIIDRLPENQEVHVDKFLTEVSNRMPYMDGGAVYEQTAQRMGFNPPKRRCSPILSTAIRELEATGTIRLQRTADASDYVQLSEDVTGAALSFNWLEISRGEVSDA